MQNTTDETVEVQSLAVRANGRALLAFAGAELTAVMTTAHSRTSTLGPSQGATIWLDVVLRRGRRVPRALVHRLTVRATAPAASRPRTPSTGRAPR